MAAPKFIARSYAGGAPSASISAPMGSTDNSFTISPTTGWETPDGHALGVDGAFCIDIDRGLSSEEKILCSSLNISTGLVEVYNSGGFNGRGYDQTTATTHTPNAGSPLAGVCIVTWTAVEASEANDVVTFVLGTAGGAQETGDFFQWSDGAPLWAALPLPSAIPTARIVQENAQAIDAADNTKITGMITDGTVVGITASSDSLTILTDGRYLVGWSAGTVTLPPPGDVIAILEKNAAFCRLVSAGSNSVDGTPVAGNMDFIDLVEGDILTLVISQNNGDAFAEFTNPNVCWLSAGLFSKAT